VQRGINVIVTFDFSARSYVVRTQGLDSEVTGESEASMQDKGLAAPESALAEGRCTAAPPKRPQDSAQTVSSTDFTINRTRAHGSFSPFPTSAFSNLSVITRRRNYSDNGEQLILDIRNSREYVVLDTHPNSERYRYTIGCPPRELFSLLSRIVVLSFRDNFCDSVWNICIL